MQKLTAVNLILPVLGEHPVTALDERHPTLAIILPALDAELEERLQSGWWFNEFDTTLYPDPVQEIYLPTDTMAFIPHRGDAIVRGRRLFNPVRGDFKWDGPVRGRTIVRVPFEELPETVARVVTYATLIRAYAADIGVESQTEEWFRKLAEVEGRAEAEHLRHKKYSTAKSPRFRRLRSAMRG